MTVEELENKAREHSLVYDTKYAEDGVLEEMLSRPQDFVESAIMNIVQLLRKKANRDGYITSAKENGVIWHDLRKNPNDLPKNQNEVLCLLWEDSYYIGYYSINSKMWCFNEFSLSEDENEDEVTAWCELPKFEEQ